MNMKKLLSIFVIAIPLQAQDPSQAGGTVTIRTDPPEAEVYLDSLKLGISPLLNVPIAPGMHRLTLFYPSSAAWNSLMRTETLSVDRGEAIEKMFELGSRISLASIPSGSKVVLQGKELGMTPMFFRSATKLSGDLVLEKEGFEKAVVPFSGVSASGLVTLRRSQEEKPSGDVVFEVPRSNGSRQWATYLSAAGMVTSGVVAAYFKERANKRFDLYLETRNPSYLASTERNDRRSAIAFFLTQVGFGLLTYFLLSE